MQEPEQAPEQVKDEAKPLAALAPLRVGRTLRFAFRNAWDNLGFVCAMSLTMFVATLLPVGVVFRAGRLANVGGQILATVGAAALYLALIPPLYAGACWLTHRIMTHDEPSLLDLGRGFAKLYGRAVLLGVAQSLITVVLVANTLFYLSRGGLPFLLLAVLFLYLLLFWAMNALYHWPLLIAGEAGILDSTAAGKAGLRPVFRNGFLLALTAPGFTFVLLVVIMALAIPLVISGVGMALLLAALVAFLTTQATRDQLVRFGVLPPPPDPDEPVEDEGWRMR